MKSFDKLLALTLLFVATTLQAATIYDSKVDIDWKAGSNVTIAASQFDNLHVADKIVINIKYIDGQTWPQVALYNGSWEPMAGAGYTSIDAKTQCVTYYATSSMIASLRASGLLVTGCGYTLQSVEIEPQAPRAEDVSTAVWIGNMIFPCNWSLYTVLPAASFANAKAGQVLRFHYKDILPNNPVLSVRNSEWDVLVDTDFENPDGPYTRFTITADMLKEIQSSGLIVAGVGYTLTHVDVVDEVATAE